MYNNQFFKYPKDKEEMTIGVFGEYPEIRFSTNAYLKMMALVDNCDIEISWFATVTREDHIYRIDEVYVQEQVCSGATTRMTEDGDARMQNELLSTKNGFDDLNKIRCWGHSHVNMGVSPSHTDISTARKFISGFNDFYITLIINKRREINCTIYDIARQVEFNSPVLKLEDPDKIDPIRSWAKNQIDEKVSRNRVNIKSSTPRIGGSGRKSPSYHDKRDRELYLKGWDSYSPDFLDNYDDPNFPESRFSLNESGVYIWGDEQDFVTENSLPLEFETNAQDEEE